MIDGFPVFAVAASSDFWTDLVLVLLELLSAAYFLALGAVVGSFLNVVVYRLPLGLGISWPPSFCPGCEAPIRPVDNIPVLSWLLLRGRCRNCQAAISIRYPAVEFLAGMIFFGLYQWELCRAGSNLPINTSGVAQGALATFWALRWDLIFLAVYHFVLFAFLLCVVLMERDGKAPPLSFVLWGLAAGLLIPLLSPDVHPITPWQWTHTESRGHLPEFGITAASLGLAAGLVLAAPRCLAQVPPRWSEFAVSILVGVFLGWQFLLFATTTAIVCRWCAGLWRVSGGRVPDSPSSCLPAVIAYALLLTWSTWRYPFFGKSVVSNLAVASGVLLVVTDLLLALRRNEPA